METPTDLTEHPIAALLPDMSGEEYGALRDDIRANGLLVPITTHDGQVLDGRHRLRACRELGIEPRHMRRSRAMTRSASSSPPMSTADT